MGNLATLAQMLRERANNIGKTSNDIKKKVVLAIVNDLVYHTPVDTSQALSNWQVSIGAPKTDFIAAYYEGEGGSTQKSSAAEAIRVATNLLKNVQPGQTVFITNNAPYIEQLNNGSSAKAPAGFVERAELLGRRVLNQEKAKHG